MVNIVSHVHRKMCLTEKEINAINAHEDLTFLTMNAFQIFTFEDIYNLFDFVTLFMKKEINLIIDGILWPIRYQLNTSFYSYYWNYLIMG
jgi:hypothetical protein